MRKKGSMTVTMSLILIVLISLLAACIQSLRTACARVQAVNGIDAGLYSLFSEYDRDLLEDYNLFFLNAGYDSDKINVGKLINRTEYFMKPILESGLTKTELQICAVDGYRLASDRKGEAVRQQIVRYMKQNMGSKGIEVLRKQFLENQEEMEEQKQVQDAGMQETEVIDTAPMPEISEKNNPLDIIKNIRQMGFLGLVLPTDMEVSKKSVNIEACLSGRFLQKGMGTFDAGDSVSDTVEQLLMQEYILEKFSTFQEKKQDGNLAYQTEYILGGKKSDEENLKYVINRLLLLREAANVAFLYTNAQKRAELEACASALSLLFLIPEGMVLVQTVLAAGWAYAESIIDVRTLLEGGKIPLKKDDLSWKTQLNHLQVETERVNKNAKGLNYQEYLRILLSLSPKETLTVRCMDMMEQNIRMKAGKEAFSMDSCMDWIAVSYQLTGPEGKLWQAERRYTYDM